MAPPAEVFHLPYHNLFYGFCGLPYGHTAAEQDFSLFAPGVSFVPMFFTILIKTYCKVTAGFITLVKPILLDRFQVKL